MGRKVELSFHPETGPALAALLVAYLVLVAALVFSFYAGAVEDLFYRADFNMFHAAGTVAWETRLIDAYQGALRAMDVIGEEEGKNPMLFSYPPQFGMMMWPLGGLPREWAYAVFMGLSLGLYLVALWRLAGRYLSGVLVAALPVLTATILNGQTSLLVGGLTALFCLAALGGRAWGGVPLALLAIKPHLAPGLVMFVLAGRRWGIFWVAAGVTVATFAITTLVFGAGIWGAFLDSAAAATGRLEGEEFKLYRMSSVYALAVTLGAGPVAAGLLHGAGAVLAMAAVAVLAWRGAPPRITLGVAVAATLAVSPYVYEYDLAILFVGLALLWGDLAVRSRGWERAVLIALCWIATYHVFVGIAVGPVEDEARDDAIAVAGIAYVLIVAELALILRRPAHPAPLAATGQTA